VVRGSSFGGRLTPALFSAAAVMTPVIHAALADPVAALRAE
jgi:hypothetical protein